MSSGVFENPTLPQLGYQQPQMPSITAAQQYAENHLALQDEVAQVEAESAAGNAISSGTAGTSQAPGTSSTGNVNTPSPTGSGSATATEQNAPSTPEGSPAASYASGLTGSAAFKYQLLMNAYQNKQLDTQIKTADLVEKFQKLSAEQQAQWQAKINSAIEDQAPAAAMLGIDQNGNLKSKPTPEQLAAATSYLERNLQGEVESGQLTKQQAAQLRQKLTNPDGTLSPEKFASVYRDTNAVAAGIKSSEVAIKQTEATAKEQNWKEVPITVNNADGTTSTKVGLLNTHTGEIKETQFQAAGKGAAGGAVDLGNADPNKPLPNKAMEADANLVANYEAKPSDVASYRGNQKTLIMARAKAINPDFDESEYGPKQAAIKSFTSGPDGRNITAVQTAYNHIKQLVPLADALQNGDTQSINRAKNAVKTWAGSNTPTNFAAVKAVALDEVTKAVTGLGGQGDREKYEKLLDAAQSPAQLDGAIAQIRKLMEGRTGPLQARAEAAGIPESKVKKIFGDLYHEPGSSESPTNTQNANDPLGIR